MWMFVGIVPTTMPTCLSGACTKHRGLDVRAFKMYADGALGSRGACLLQPYSDQKNTKGFLLSSQQHFQDVAEKLAAKGFQLCTHAIGDSANRVILKIYASVLKGRNDRRWRIEHAQVLRSWKTSINSFGDYSIIPSVQAKRTATSDMYWAGERLGKKRLKTSYAYKQLLEQNGWLPLGTDFPVENINPIYTFYAAVERKDLKRLSRWRISARKCPYQAAGTKKGMTIWAAKSNFEEKRKRQYRDRANTPTFGGYWIMTS